MLSKLLRLGEGRMVKRLARVADYVDSLSDDVAKLTDAELRPRPTSSRSATPTGKASMTCCPRRSRWPGRRPGEYSTSARSTCR
ncbi:translocase subunit secA 1 domain protein [Mycobacterium xenopi 3993]|nr:translocase subunit secA 1 domain protein [Mycobacterium xenopi 3993]